MSESQKQIQRAASENVAGQTSASPSWSQSPVLWGLLATVIFYAGIRFLPVYQETAQRYFCSHPLEYALVGLFFVGLSILASRSLRLSREQQSLRDNVLNNVAIPPPENGDPSTSVQGLDAALDELPAADQDTLFVTRLRDASRYLKTHRSARGLDEHLKYLSEAAVDRLYESYSLLLTINWAVPIIGFLGTVVGITLAIANVTPEQLDTSLNNVTGGLSVAFDTTTVAMSFSLVLVFVYDWIKRSELRLLSKIEQISLTQLLPSFVGEGAHIDPVHEAQTTAAKQLLDRTESLIQDQTALWQDSMDGLRERWSDTLDSQQQALSGQLTQGVESTLSEHADQLQEVRQEFLGAFESASTQFQEALQFDAARRDLQDAQSHTRQQEMWAQIHDSLREVVQAHDARTEDLLEHLGERMQEWQATLASSTQAADAQLQKLTEYTSQLVKLGEQEHHLLRVEQQLAENLETVRAAETFEQTLHNLTAAVHLLTARARPKAA